MKNLIKKVRFFSILWEKILGDWGVRDYTEKWAEGFFLLFTLSLFKRNERKIFIPYQKRDEKGNQSNAQWSRKSSRIQRNLYKEDW